MDLPVWQELYEELKEKNFAVVAVAFDTGGAAAAGEWIRKANPTYPCLIDEHHLVAELYNMINVPSAVWIDEQGRIVRPAEPAGSSDAFRSMDHSTYKMPDEAVADLRLRRSVYLNALRDWVAKSAGSVHVFSPAEARKRAAGPSKDHALATANFRLGTFLVQQDRADEAQHFFAEASRLQPDSWNFKRQAWSLEAPGKAGGPEFWAAVDALGEKRYYPVVDMEGMPR